MDVGDWERFFDELYLRRYAPRQNAEASEAEALAAVRLAGCPPGADVLDAPCGYGRHAIPLAQAGFRVVGADRSPAMLAEAKRRGEEREWPRFVQADYRELPFPDGSFDAVLNLFTSIGYLGEEGDRAGLGELRRVLRPGGCLVLETMHRDRLIRIFQARSWEPLPDGSRLLEERRFDPVESVIEGTHKLLPEDGEPISFVYRLRVYTATELARMLADAGFAELGFFGGFEEEPLSAEARLVVRARAPAE